MPLYRLERLEGDLFAALKADGDRVALLTADGDGIALLTADGDGIALLMADGTLECVSGSLSKDCTERNESRPLILDE